MTYRLLLFLLIALAALFSLSLQLADGFGGGWERFAG